MANFVQHYARESMVPQSFVFGSDQASQEKFTRLFNDVQALDVVRVKVWDRESRVIYSDDESIIGKYFPENEELRESLDGKVLAEIQEPIKPENVKEVGYTQLLEVYVPIYFEGNSQPSGIIETYFNLDEVNNLISKIRIIIFISMFIIIASVFISVWILFWFLVRKRLALIVQMSRKIAGGDLEARVEMKGRDEIGELATAFNTMSAKLKELYMGLEQKVRDRTKQLESDNKMMIGRELRMVELKKEIENLKKRVNDGNGNQ
jgi:methyl-accepting chemotaxis protein